LLRALAGLGVADAFFAAVSRAAGAVVFAGVATRLAFLGAALVAADFFTERGFLLATAFVADAFFAADGLAGGLGAATLTTLLAAEDFRMVLAPGSGTDAGEEATARFTGFPETFGGGICDRLATGAAAFAELRLDGLGGRAALVLVNRFADAPGAGVLGLGVAAGADFPFPVGLAGSCADALRVFCFAAGANALSRRGAFLGGTAEGSGVAGPDFAALFRGRGAFCEAAASALGADSFSGGVAASTAGEGAVWGVSGRGSSGAGVDGGAAGGGGACAMAGSGLGCRYCLGSPSKPSVVSGIGAAASPGKTAG
jgi:hypothetical protein